MKRNIKWGLKEWLLFLGILLLAVIVAVLLTVVIPVGILSVFTKKYPEVDGYLMTGVVYNWSVCVVLLLLAVVLIVRKIKFFPAYAALVMLMLMCGVSGWWHYQDIRTGPLTAEIRDAVIKDSIRSDLHLVGLCDGEKISLGIPSDAPKYLEEGNEYEYIIVEYYENIGEIIKVIDLKRDLDLQDVQDMLNELWAD
ncbi:MAG: hypothetical protein IKL04_00080 [Lachnospiraceae bacterium]|nr:hypothetical protein [Lachnospiraceae bacterium]